jgi:hypothetical protein
MNLASPNLLQAASRPPNTFRMDSLLEEMRYVESKYICELSQNRVRMSFYCSRGVCEPLAVNYLLLAHAHTH